MGKGGGENCARELNLSLVGADADERPVDYNSRELNYVEVTDQAGLYACVEALRHPDVKAIALDIETTGGLKPWQGSIRYIQLGIEEPEPKQFLLDMWKVSPAPILPFLEDPDIEIITCNGRYEQLHLLYRYGVVIRNLYDVCYSEREITKHKQQPAKDRFEKRLQGVKDHYDRRIAETRALLEQRTAEQKVYKQMVRGAKKSKDQQAEALAAGNLADVEAEIAELKATRDALKSERKQAVDKLKEQAPNPRPIKGTFRHLMRRYVNKKISKEQQTSPWDDEQLSKAQKVYAAMDVAGLHDIARQQKKEVARRGLEEQVRTANESVYESVRTSIEKFPQVSRDDVDRLLRAFRSARSVEELDRFRDLTGRLSLAHQHLPEIDQAYTECWLELVTSSPAPAQAEVSPTGLSADAADELPF